ncbi:Proton-dependent oligopeptide transporter family [Arabidopsis suecica]|uniref:Proton-dependent oligopeptide transporter family n=1 Tax=Arabidopsis suecica TaxID=45249 RepID=A0A8T2BKM2_ARASU|nr:Proton-dependent oligopeptide transporter family [Arabidopsis suecica]
MNSNEDERIILDVEKSLLIQEEVNNVLTGLSSSAEDGSVDIYGNPPSKKKTGNWKACPFILGNECCERLAYYGIAKNLITYYTSELHESNVSAASDVMIWQGTCYITPLIGAVIADSYWGRYWTIASFSAIYFIGMALLTLSASVPGLKPAECVGFVAVLCPPATTVQYGVFFSGLYLIALGTGGIKPCVSSFGADQFDDTDPRERVRKASFFNWFYFSINIGSFISSTLLVWVQENVGWGLGFLIPTVFMGASIASFFIGTPLYRFQKPGGSPITRVCQVLVAAYRKLKLNLPEDISFLYETSEKNSIIAGSRKIQHTDGYKKISVPFQCLDKAAVISEDESKSGAFSNPWKLCTVTQVEEVKILIRMFPIWASGIIYSVLYSQISTLFVQQGRAMNRVLLSFEIPPASFGVFDTLIVLIAIPIYDRFIVPFVRRFTGIPKGLTDLQRMGIGLFICVLSIAAAAIVETVRLQLIQDTISMSIFWQIPQYILMGIAEVFFFIGRVEFFYDQSPDAMRSVCSALALLNTAVGSYLSSLILTLVAYLTTIGGKDGWIPDDLNEGHLDYFFWLLVSLGLINIPVYAFFSVKHTKKKAL